MGKKEEIEPYPFKNGLNQYIATVICNLIMFSHGFILGWTSPAIPKLTSEIDTPLSDGPLTPDQVSWIGSVNMLGAIVGSLTVGYIISSVGCKRTMMLLTIPLALFWFVIYFGDMYYHILIARSIGGWTGGCIMACIMIYVTDIANDDIRGSLSAIAVFMRNLSILASYILGANLDYRTIPCVVVFVPLIYMICFAMIPNTPQFHISNGKLEKAEKALKFYKGCKGHNVKADIAITKELERLNRMNQNKKETGESIKFEDIFNKSALKGLSIGVGLCAFSLFTGNFTIISYGSLILAKAKSTMDPHVCSYVLAIALIVGSFATPVLADRLGRKLLNTITLLGAAVGLFSTSLYYYLNQNHFDLSEYDWIVIVSLSFVVIMSSADIVPLAIVCSVEYTPQKIRTFGTSFIVFSLSALAFVMMKLFPILLEKFDLHGALAIYGFGCVIGALLIIFVTTETSGQSLDADIEEGEDERLRISRIQASRLSSICSL